MNQSYKSNQKTNQNTMAIGYGLQGNQENDNGFDYDEVSMPGRGSSLS